MIPYFLLVGLPILVWLISTRYRFTIGKRVLLETSTLPMDFFMLIFLLLLALRGLDCGSDTPQYEVNFMAHGKLSYAGILRGYDNERGFILLSRFIYGLGGSFQVFLWVSSSICVLPLWYMYRNESDNYPLTMALFLTVSPFYMYFSGIRQAIAMSLGVFAWYAAKNRKLLYFLLAVFAAMQFHNSAFILVAIYPLYRAKITKRWLWVVVPFMVFVFVNKLPIFNFLLQFLWEDFESTPETGATTILILLVIFAVYSYLIPDDAKIDQDVIGLRNILLLSIVIQFFAILHPLSMRMNYYFLPFVPILIPKIAKRSKMRFRQISKLSVVVMTVFFLCYFVNLVVNDIDSLNIYPYIPYWEN